MKKEEAKELSIKRVNLILEYIEQILLDNKVVGILTFNSKKINNQNILVLDIEVKPNNFSRYLNLEIESNHSNILYEELLNEIINRYLENENIVLSFYQDIKYFMESNFSGITITNFNGSEIKINFKIKDHKFSEIIENYELALSSKLIEKDNKKELK